MNFKILKPAAFVQPSSSAEEKTHPESVVSAMFTANKAENLGAVFEGSAIISMM